MKVLFTICLLGGLATAGLTGCSSSSSSGALPPSSDGGTALNEGGPDAGACDFAAFVINLVNTDTTMTAQPSTNLGQTCVDQQNQAQFSALFP
jgi:hypothetical protein